MKCYIVQDMLPLYCDGLTSEESSSDIRGHLDGCAECRKAYEDMKSEELPAAKLPEREIKPLKKVRKRFITSIFAFVCTAIVLYIGLFVYYFALARPMRSGDADAEAYIVRITDNGQSDFSKCDYELHIRLRGRDYNRTEIRVKSAAQITDRENRLTTLTLDASAYRAPFFGKTQDEYIFYIHEQEISDDSCINVKFRDKTVKYSINDLIRQGN